MNSLLLIAIFLPAIAAPCMTWIGGRSERLAGRVAALFPLMAFGSILAIAIGAEWQPGVVIEYPWIPSLGVNLSFLVDGLSLFFGLIVTGMGVLIALYAQPYMHGHYKRLGQFYCYLLLFMSAMLGTVFSNNFLLLFVFWELTGLASFLLIGFSHEREESRNGARMALLITGATGLAMLAGVVMIFMAGGTYSIAALMDSPEAVLGKGTGWMNTALLLILAGAFGKSAQFPVHFWLPNAMVAPTPVSAYLHSATMVKLGVFLVARMFPVFSGTDLWMPALVAVCLTTMLLGSVLALLSHDIKAILAYATVSQLGFFLFFYGVGDPRGVPHDFWHILNHVFYKGSLFMVAGIVDHAAGSRDVRALGGLFRRMPLTGITCLIGVATMAGIPGTTAFLSKELALTELLRITERFGPPGLLIIGCIMVASTLQVAFSLRLFHRVFLARPVSGGMRHFHRPALGIQVPPLLLAICALAFGIVPGPLGRLLAKLHVPGLHSEATGGLALWHGFTPELLISACVFSAGLALFWIGTRTGWRWEVPRWLHFGVMFERLVESVSPASKRLTALVRSDRPQDYLPIVALVVAAMAGSALLFQDWNGVFAGAPGAAEHLNVLRTAVALLIAISVLSIPILKEWTAQLIALSVAGFLIAFYFVLYRAPDLALTQILIEVVTVVMVLLLLARFPRSAERSEIADHGFTRRNALSMVAAVAVGVTVSGFLLLSTTGPAPERAGEFFLENTMELAHGANTVNTILVDFRGFDTLGEITVLLIAVLGCLGLLMRYRRRPDELRAGPMGPPGIGIRSDEEET